MGTRGRSGLEAVLIGSETAKVIFNTSLPTLAIPTNATNSKINRLFYALDLNEEIIDTDVKLVNSIVPENKIVRLLHNYHDALEVSTSKESELLGSYQYKFPSDKIFLDLAFMMKFYTLNRKL